MSQFLRNTLLTLLYLIFIAPVRAVSGFVRWAARSGAPIVKPLGETLAMTVGMLLYAFAGLVCIALLGGLIMAVRGVI